MRRYPLRTWKPGIITLKAIELDSGFALAYIGVANCLLFQYIFYQDHREVVLKNAKQALDRAVEIDPDLPYAHIVLGKYYYLGLLDYKKSLEQFEIVLKDEPDNSLALAWSANTYGLMNNPELERACYDSSRLLLEKKIVDVPEDPNVYAALGLAYAGLGLEDQAISTSRNAVKIMPVSKDAIQGVTMAENPALYLNTKYYILPLADSGLIRNRNLLV